jgi:hypothetical protein
MTQRASESLVAALIRVGLLLALVIMLMAENAQAQPPSHLFRSGNCINSQQQPHPAGTRSSGLAH